MSKRFPFISSLGDAFIGGALLSHLCNPPPPPPACFARESRRDRGGYQQEEHSGNTLRFAVTADDFRGGRRW